MTLKKSMDRSEQYSRNSARGGDSVSLNKSMRQNSSKAQHLQHSGADTDRSNYFEHHEGIDKVSVSRDSF